MFQLMHTLHDALPWPAADPEHLARVAEHLGSIADSIRTSVQSWHPPSPRWVGTSATAHRTELGRIRAAGGSLAPQLHIAAMAITRLTAAIEAGRAEIRSISLAIRSAEEHAAELLRTARAAQRLAETAATGDPVSLVAAQRLRDDAARAHRRADEAAAEAGRLLSRGIAAAEDVVTDLSRRDGAAAHELDGLFRDVSGATARGGLKADRATFADRPPITDRLPTTAKAIRRHVDALAEAVVAIEAVPWGARTWWESMALAHLTEELGLHRRFLAPGRQMLDWDPVGDGRAVEVFGDLAKARHIAVVVPGIMNTIENFDDQLSRHAKELWVEAGSRDNHTAVIAWLGYDTPELLNAVSKRRATEHEIALRSFVQSLPRGAHVTVVAHSYGTVLTAEASARGLAADELVLVGSPGTRLDHVSDASLEPGAQVFAAVSDSDWVVGRTGYGSVVCPEQIVGVGWLADLPQIMTPATGPFSWITDSCDIDGDGDVKSLSHGINPAHEDFGAIEISTDGVNGHSSYFDPGSSSLEAIAQIVTGTHPEQR